MKKRLDVLLVERRLAESRTQAQALVLAGRVPGYEKPGTQVDENAELEVSAPPPYVSRGGEKLANALDAFGVDPSVATRSTSERRPAASPTSCCSVALRAWPPSTSATASCTRSCVPIRESPFSSGSTHASCASFLSRPDLIVCDVSFISVRLALPPALELGQPGWEALVLVKPQFEAGRSEAKGGVVRDAEVRRRVVREIAEAALGWGAETVGAVDSGVPGPKGNREVFLHLRHREHAQLPHDIDERIAAAIV